MKNRIISIILSAAILLVLLPAYNSTAKADDENVYVPKTVNAGVEGIAEPTSTGRSAAAWAGDYVYFGVYDKTPVKFRVLNTAETDFSSQTEPTLFWIVIVS